MLLGDLGADVRKVEPLSGDTARRLGPPWVNGESSWFMSLNRNKRSIALDLKHAKGLEAAQRLMAGADIVVESFRPGVADRLCVGYEHAKRLSPKVIYCSISAFGQQGPWSNKPGVDGIVQAVSGLMSTLGQEGQEPSKVPVPVVDMVTGYLASVAISAALHKRRTTNESIHLDMSMLASALFLQQTAYASWLISGELPAKTGSAAPYACPNEAYQCQDGWLMIAAYQASKWQALCSLLSVPELADDPRFATLPARVANRQALKQLLTEVLMRKTCSYWTALLGAGGIMAEQVLDYEGVWTLPPLDNTQRTQSFDHPSAGPIELPAFGLPAHRSEGVLTPPALGQHSRELLADIGYEGREINELERIGAAFLGAT